MPVRTTDISFGGIETDRYDAVFCDGSKRAVDLLLPILVKNQEYMTTPGGREISVGPPTYSTRVAALDLKDGEFVDITKDPDFEKFERRLPPG